MTASHSSRAHPRLFITEVDLERLILLQPGQGDFTDHALSSLDRFCEACVPWHAVPYQQEIHNPLLIRARHAQKIIWSLCLQWKRTGKERFRQAVLDYLKEMGEWTYWSSDCMRDGNTDPQANFDLSYGENCFTIALAYDLLFASLSEAERKAIHDMAFRWGIEPGRKFCREGGATWFRYKNCNWNTVCAGGLGALVLSMEEEIEDASELLAQVELSLTPYFEYLDENNGGWPEGLGYWNYGMRYAYLYVFSWEHARGQTHRFMEGKGSQQTVHFPLDFFPRGACVGFGDVNQWRPLPFHIRLAARYGEEGVLRKLREAIEGLGADYGAQSQWPVDALSLVFAADLVTTASLDVEQAGQRIYQPMGWGVMKCGDPKGIYVSVRGGSSKVPHSHQDLMAICVVVGDEPLLSHHGTGYLDTTFSSRRYDLPELSALYKNTLFVNGVSLPPEAVLDETSEVSIQGYLGMRLLGTQAMEKVMRNQALSFLGRLVLRLSDDAVLLVDRCHQPSYGLFEARFHTTGDVHLSAADEGHSACVHGERSQLHFAFVGSGSCVLASSGICTTLIGEDGGRLLRFGTPERQSSDCVLVTLMSLKPVEDLTLAREGDALEISWTIENESQLLQVQADLC
ncbi:heparinase II/III family protein [Kiritimatiellota bacterium B12222]|nr:heparinase II/III family protein [Kiritimatiellota bacterium B12222]